MTITLNQRTGDTAPQPYKLPPVALGKFSQVLPPSLLLYRARCLLGVSRQQMAEYMGIPSSLLSKFEYGKLRIPPSFLLKIFMFGLDFWTDGMHWVAYDEGLHGTKKKQKHENQLQDELLGNAPYVTETDDEAPASDMFSAARPENAQ